MKKYLWALWLIFVIPGGLTACNEGPAEEIGEDIDDAVDDVEDEF